MNKAIHFLLSNDDGFRAPGIQELAQALLPLGNVTVVAPDGPRSGFSSAISTTSALRLKNRHNEEGLSIYSVEGTPADCIKLALPTLFRDAPPSLVISGINHGSNDGICVHYSGTIGAAREACIADVPALAISIDNVSEHPNLFEAIRLSIEVIQHLLKQPFPKGTFYSLNIPKGKSKGLKVCRHAVSRFVNEWMPSSNARGQKVYWMTGQQRYPLNPQGDTDIEWLRAGYATLSPLQLDITNYAVLEQMLDSGFTI